MGKHGPDTQLDGLSIDIGKRPGRKLPSGATGHDGGMGQRLGNEDGLSKVQLLLGVQIAPHGRFRGPFPLFHLSTKGALYVPKLSKGPYIQHPAAGSAQKAQGCSSFRRLPRPAPIKPSNDICSYSSGISRSVASIHCHESKSEIVTVWNGNIRSADPPALWCHAPHRRQTDRPQFRSYSYSGNDRDI